MARLCDAMGTIGSFLSWTRPRITVRRFRSKAEASMDGGLDIVMIAYLPLMSGPLRQPPGGGQFHLPLAEGPGAGAARAGDRAFAAFARADRPRQP